MGHGPESAIEFGKLNAAERTALGLLAQGHTAKSIATLTDRSVGAVNERLREARRKTGVGSSRELARMFAAQQNRDELIGVAPASDPDPDPIPPAAWRRSWKGAVLMSGILLGAIGAIFMVAQPAPQTSPSAVTPPGTGAPLYSDAPSPRQLHDRIVAERRDPAWAPATEAALEKWFASQPTIVRVTRPAEAHCGSTMCEVVARYDTKMPDGRLNDALHRMQGKPFHDAIAPMGLDFDSGSFGDGAAILFVTRRSG